jgi:antitoxin HigA-1
MRKINTHPGDIIREELIARGLSANKLALALGVPSGRIVEILNRKRAVSADTALRLARYFGTSPEVWLNIQVKYDLAAAEREHGKEIAERVKRAS